VQRTVRVLDYARVYLVLGGKFQSLQLLMRELDEFLA
jgi:hypothetical protein